MLKINHKIFQYLYLSLRLQTFSGFFAAASALPFLHQAINKKKSFIFRGRVAWVTSLVMFSVPLHTLCTRLTRHISRSRSDDSSLRLHFYSIFSFLNHYSYPSVRFRVWLLLHSSYKADKVA